MSPQDEIPVHPFDIDEPPDDHYCPYGACDLCEPPGAEEPLDAPTPCGRCDWPQQVWELRCEACGWTRGAQHAPGPKWFCGACGDEHDTEEQADDCCRTGSDTWRIRLSVGTMTEHYDELEPREVQYDKSSDNTSAEEIVEDFFPATFEWNGNTYVLPDASEWAMESYDDDLSYSWCCPHPHGEDGELFDLSVIVNRRGMTT